MQFWKPFITSLLPANSIVAKLTPTSTVSVNTNGVGPSAGTVASSFIAKPRADRLSNVPNKRRTLQPLAPRQHTPSFSLADFIGGWNLIWNDWESFTPSPDVASSLITLYQNIYSTAVQAVVQPATGLITLTYGAIQIIFEAAEKILQISWEVVEGFAK